MRNILKKYDLSRSFFIFDFFLFTYISSLISHKLGYGFDAIYCRITFLLMFSIYIIKLCIDFLNNKKRKFMGYHFIWSLLFWGYGLISILWSFDDFYIYNFNINIIIQIICVTLVLFYRIQSVDDFHIVLKIILYSVIYMCILILLRCPIDQLGSDRMGRELGIHANAFGRYTAFGLIIAFYLFLNIRKKIYMLVILFLLTLLFLSGSRTALLLFFGGVVGNIILFISKRTKYVYLLLSFFIMLLIVNWLINSPVMYNLIGWRLEGVIGFLSKNGDIDASTSERLFFISTAKELFYKYPIFGAGLNNFRSYLVYIGYDNVTYSHCNHWEILCSLGLVGYLLYYFIYFNVLFKGLVNFKLLGNHRKFCLLIILMLLIIDYTIVSYYDVFYQIIISICVFGMDIKEKNEACI